MDRLMRVIQFQFYYTVVVNDLSHKEASWMQYQISSDSEQSRTLTPSPSINRYCDNMSPRPYVIVEGTEINIYSSMIHG